MIRLKKRGLVEVAMDVWSDVPECSKSGKVEGGEGRNGKERWKLFNWRRVG